MNNEIDTKLVQELIDCKACVSRAEARRIVLCLPHERVRQRIERAKACKKEQA